MIWVEACLQEVGSKIMEENNIVIRSSIYKLVSMLLLHPILVARNVKNILKTNKKINLYDGLRAVHNTLYNFSLWI